MKLLIFSDSHGNLSSMLEIVEKEQPDEVFHLGDHLKDAQELSYAFPELPMVMVPGNCDGWTGVPDRRLEEREGARILLAHGHQWRVKSGPEQAVAAAQAAGADVLLYGHTHRAVCRRAGGLWVLNPGTVGGQWEPPSYGLLIMKAGELSCKTIAVK